MAACVLVYAQVRSARAHATAPTMWRDDLRRLGRSSYIPCGQCAIGVAADELFPLMVPGYRVDCLKDTRTKTLLSAMSFQGQTKKTCCTTCKILFSIIYCMNK